MYPPGTIDELRELLETVERCLARTTGAQRDAAKNAEHYRFQAAESKRQATRAHSPEIRASLLRIAASHDRLMQLAEGRMAASERSDHSAPEPARAASEPAPGTKLPEDPAAQARRHVAEMQERVKRQQALLAKLASDPRHAALAAEAEEILQTLKHTLHLAREHLAIELQK